MSQRASHLSLSRRKALLGIGAGGVALAQNATRAFAHGAGVQSDVNVQNIEIKLIGSVSMLPSASALNRGDLVQTTGFYQPGDGGGALYRISAVAETVVPNGADIIDIQHGLVAELIENEAINYRMFGAVGDGQNDDGVQIKQAHEYAGRHQLPIVNLNGEFWLKQTNNIPITTSAYWGKTTFHIDEQHNAKRYSRFVVLNDDPPKSLTANNELKATLLKQLKPGVQLIPELAEYAGHLISVVDTNDRIGIRAGAGYSKRGWAREEFFYVEEEGRIIGDIAWSFNDLTRITATPCSRNYLVIEGGSFQVSGDTPADNSPGYHSLGISIQRSRTIVRQQWVGLENGRRDTSLEPRSGFYSLSNVYDVTLENIRAMPWEKNRRDKSKAVKHGTYGISGARMLNCTFRNITAEAGWVSWGVFGTNLNKNFRVEHCTLNRIDVHFHCWNLYISDCVIGFKGITVTGGGDLFIDDTTRHGNTFVSFRPDYGAKWDGRIRIRRCTLRPNSNSRASVLSYRPGNFDYKYPIGYGRSIAIEDLLIDYAAVPSSTAPCWLLDIAPFSMTSDGTRLFFPRHLVLKNIAVEGRPQGVRIMRIEDPQNYRLLDGGRYDDGQLHPNCSLVCESVQLEELEHQDSEGPQQFHLAVGLNSPGDYADAHSLYPIIRVSDCEHISIFLGNIVASAFLDRCSVNVVDAENVRGELSFTNCTLRPVLKQASGDLYKLRSSLGTRFTNCTVHAPVVAGEAAPRLLDKIEFLKINDSVKHFHLNTALGQEVLAYLRSRGIELSPSFVAKLQSHYAEL